MSDTIYLLRFPVTATSVPKIILLNPETDISPIILSYIMMH